jgi:hypothetical protein
MSPDSIRLFSNEHSIGAENNRKVLAKHFGEIKTLTFLKGGVDALPDNGGKLKARDVSKDECLWCSRDTLGSLAEHWTVEEALRSMMELFEDMKASDYPNWNPPTVRIVESK